MPKVTYVSVKMLNKWLLITSGFTVVSTLEGSPLYAYTLHIHSGSNIKGQDLVHPYIQVLPYFVIQYIHDVHSLKHLTSHGHNIDVSIASINQQYLICRV